MFEKQTDRIVNIDKEKYEINSLHSCYEFIRCAAFEKSIQIYCTITILIIFKQKTKKLIINIASIFFTLTEINNETHYVPKKAKKRNKTKKQKQKNKKKLLR